MTNPISSTRSARLLGTVAAGLMVLSACGSSTPSIKRVALDVVETQDITDEQKSCMREKVDGYSNDELEAMVTRDGQPIKIDVSDPSAISDATPELKTFVDDLRTSCVS